MIMPARMIMPVMVMAIGQEPDAGHIHDETESRNGDGFCEADRHGEKEPPYRFITDQQRDHGKHDRALKAREIAGFSGPEGEPPIMDVSSRKATGERREQKGSRRGYS